MAKEWYIVHTYSGYEKSVKESLKKRIESMGMQSQFGEILVPEEDVVELKGGKRKITKKRLYPGYILIEMDMNDNTLQLVRKTPRISGFLGGEENPPPISSEEVKRIMARIQGAEEKTLKTDFEKGDRVKVISGPFQNFTGEVDEVKPEKGKVRVLVSIFGRQTPIELEFEQLQRI